MERLAPGLVPIVEDVHRRLRGHAPGRAPRVSFYPYVDTKCTVRVRDGRLFLRISDHMQGAEDDAIAGVVAMLLCQLWGRPERHVPELWRKAYYDFVQDERTQQRRGHSRRERGRKHIDPIGDHRSLLESFLRVSLEMGITPAAPPKLGWSKTPSRNRFGHWDEDHQAIIISRVLDDPNIPGYVLDFVVYHELLHVVMPPTMGSGGRRRVHPPEFVAAERRFPKWRQAERWLEKLAR